MEYNLDALYQDIKYLIFLAFELKQSNVILINFDQTVRSRTHII